MFSAELIQRIVHLLDVGTGSRVVRVLMIGLLVSGLALWYDLRGFKNFSTPEAMDAAQLARNIAQGRGYTTDFVRPFSVFLVRQWNEAQSAGKSADPNADFAKIQQAHPDLANPPVYPLLLAGWMKVLPFQWQVQEKKNFWSEDGHFARYQPDFLIVLLNQLLLVVVVWQTFLIARKLFDPEVAWLSASLVLGCEMLWKFSVAGLSTILLLVIFLGLVRLLLRLEEAGRAAGPAVKLLFKLAFLVGMVAGLGALTRYAFGAVVLPLALFIGLFGGRERGRQVLCALGGFLLVLAPWVLRNYLVSGTLFGTAGFGLMEGNAIFTGFFLERSLHPDLTNAWLVMPYVNKLVNNGWEILQTDLPMLGRSWAVMLFVAGLMLAFRGVPIRRFRWFLLMCLAALAAAQALGRTQLSEVSPVVNSENLLVLALPLIMIYAVAFFVTCLDQFEMPLLVPLQPMRYAAMAGLVVVLCLPMVGALFSRRANPVAYPPYYPPEIQAYAGWMKEREMLMSDVPWAVAWYGHRQCMWLSLDARDDFYAVNDGVKPVKALYLTPETMDARLMDGFMHAPADSWEQFVFKRISGDFAINVLNRKKAEQRELTARPAAEAVSGDVPFDVAMTVVAHYLHPEAYTTPGLGSTALDDPSFPLKVTFDTGPLNSTLFLTDRKRWLAPLQ